MIRNEINRRLDAVEELKEQAISREEIREYLSPVYDLERLITKITYGSANPRDLTAFKSSLEMLPPICYILEEMKASLLQEIYEDLDRTGGSVRSCDESDPGRASDCNERGKYYPGRV